MEWFETACIFILVKEDAFHDADLMDSESNFDFSSDLGVSIYFISIYLPYLSVFCLHLHLERVKTKIYEILPLTLIVSQWKNLVNLHF